MKVQLIDERVGAKNLDTVCVTPIKSSLPFYEKPGDGYVHRVRSGSHIRFRDGSFSHTHYRFWCGFSGFVFAAGTAEQKKSHAALVANPSRGRVICATCEGRATGSGQLGKAKVRGNFVKFMPKGELYPQPRRGK